MHPREKILFDPKKVKFDMPLLEAFRLTQVRSLEDYRSLRGNLADLRGISYFFINCLEGKAKLMITIITAEKDEVTASYALDYDLLGISYEDLMNAICGESGNYPLSHEMEQKLMEALENDRWRFFKAE